MYEPDGTREIGSVIDDYGCHVHVGITPDSLPVFWCCSPIRLSTGQRERFWALMDQAAAEAAAEIASQRNTLADLAAVAATFGAVMAQAQAGTRLFSPPLTAAEATVRHD